MCKEECWKRWRAVADLLDRPELIQDLVVRDGSSLEAGDEVLRAVDDLDPLYVWKKMERLTRCADAESAWIKTRSRICSTLWFTDVLQYSSVGIEGDDRQLFQGYACTK